jgi:hypothetical protein
MRAVVALCVALALGATSVAVAQPAPVGQQQRRERIKKRIQALRAYMLLDQLGVDEQLSGKVLGVFTKYDEEFEKLLAARADLNRRINALTPKDAKPAVDKLIDDTLANQHAFRDVEGRRLDELRKLLTPQQTARLLVVLPALERRIQNQLRRAIKGPGGKAKAGRPDFGDDDSDDDLPDPPPRPLRR